ncbi:hypothetical protein RYH73_14870 [Olivibacter sp. CPCC 100613]|uniref:hypothetical protein n=1 Tax=Olivibacter sp. CPCC 100613 TaxID=3079931 RepID=UPI002FFCFAF3
MNYFENFTGLQQNLIDSIKKVLFRRVGNIFDRLDFYDDEIYMEPLLYAFLAQPDDKWLDSIIIGYESDKKKEIDVFSNSSGIIYIPNVGYFKTDLMESSFKFHYSSGSEHGLFQDGLPVNYEFEPIYKLKNGVEVQIHPHPLLEPLFPFKIDKKVQNDLKDAHMDHLENSFLFLQLGRPEFYDTLLSTLKRVMLFNGTEPNSFAVFGAHNMVFLNVNHWDNEMFFIDHLSHEGSHVIFNTLTYYSKQSELFNVSYDTSFAEITGRKEEHSDLYSRFHGLFTFVEILKSLKSTLTMQQIDHKLVHETYGRIAFQLNRFDNSLKSFKGLGIFKEEGLLWFRYFENEFEELNNEFGHLRTKYKLSSPTYDFNGQVFLERNPISN